MNELERIIESVLFLADEPTPASELAQLAEVHIDEVDRTLRDLARSMETEARGLVLREVAGGWRLTTHPDLAPYLERFISESRAGRISQAALETLAIVAYRQPISRAQVAEIRGVSSEGVLRTLIARGVVEEVGRDPGPGQAILYGTTGHLLERLGLHSLADLPPLAEFMPSTESVERMESGLGPGI